MDTDSSHRGLRFNAFHIFQAAFLSHPARDSETMLRPNVGNQATKDNWESLMMLTTLQAGVGGGGEGARKCYLQS